MKKFTDLNNTNNSNKVEQSKTKKELISNIIQESLRIENGVIIGKDILIETFNKLIEINDHKSRVSVLESIKLMSYRGNLNFNTINESIEIEKNRIKYIIENKIDDILVDEEVELLTENINESKVSKEFKDIVKKSDIKFTVDIDKVLKEIKNDKNGDEIKTFIKELSVAVNKIKSECDECNETEVNESLTDPNLLTVLLGAGGIILTSTVIVEIMTALESGKFGDKGKKIAHMLGVVGGLVNSGKTPEKPELEEDKKKDEKIKESLLLDKYTDSDTIGMDNINYVYESIMKK